MVCRTWSMKAVFPFLVVLQYTDLFVIRPVQETAAHRLPHLGIIGDFWHIYRDTNVQNPKVRDKQFVREGKGLKTVLKVKRKKGSKW